MPEVTWPCVACRGHSKTWATGRQGECSRCLRGCLLVVSGVPAAYDGVTEVRWARRKQTSQSPLARPPPDQSLGMKNENETGRKSSDKKTTPLGGNLVWYLLALCLGALLMFSMLTPKT